MVPGVLPPQFRLPNAGLDSGGEADMEAGPSAAPSVFVFPCGKPTDLWPVNVDVSTMTYPPSDGAPAITSTILTAIPVQGRPLREKTLYVAVVTTQVAESSQFVADLCAGKTPAGISDTAIAGQYSDVIHGDLQKLGLSCGDVAAISLFETSNPTQEFRQVQQLAHADYLKNQGSWRRCDAHARRCARRSRDRAHAVRSLPSASTAEPYSCRTINAGRLPTSHTSTGVADGLSRLCLMPAPALLACPGPRIDPRARGSQIVDTHVAHGARHRHDPARAPADPR